MNFIFYLLAMVIFFFFAGFTLSGKEGLIRLVELKKTKSEIVQKNRELLQENLKLWQEQKSLYQLNIIEHQARESLGLVYADEIVYLLNSKGTAN